MTKLLLEPLKHYRISKMLPSSGVPWQNQTDKWRWVRHSRTRIHARTNTYTHNRVSQIITVEFSCSCYMVMSPFSPGWILWPDTYQRLSFLFFPNIELDSSEVSWASLTSPISYHITAEPSAALEVRCSGQNNQMKLVLSASDDVKLELFTFAAAQHCG